MTIYISRGRFTSDAVKGMVARTAQCGSRSTAVELLWLVSLWAAVVILLNFYSQLARRSGLMHRSKQHRYSITSLARPISVLGTLTPSALAVFRLIYISTLVTCCTGRSAGFSPLRTLPV
jgi:hypothetical protein